jgi:hypothetical protein
VTHETVKKPDAFKAVMAAARSELGRPELAHQSLGRALSPQEEALADALMEIYAGGASGPEAVAAALAQKGVICPSTGSTEWTADSLARELAALNADLDAAYQENGFGA